MLFIILNIVIKKKRLNRQLSLIGLFLALYGITIFLYLPFIILTLNLIGFVVFIVALLLSIFVGFTLIVLGFKPVFQRIALYILNRFKRLQFIIKTNLSRHKGRSQITSLQLAFCFSFVIFVGSVFSILNMHIQQTTYYSNGSDLVLERMGGGPIIYMEGEFDGEMPGNTTSSFLAENSFYQQEMTDADLLALSQIDGIERVSGIPYSHQMVTFNGETQMTDYAALFPTQISLYGIDENYLETVYSEYVEIEGGDVEEGFDKLTEGQYCIIARSLAEQFNLEVGDPVEISFESEFSNIEDDYIIAAIASAMPGFEDTFKSLEIMAGGGGVLISKENYLELMQSSSPSMLEKVFIRLTEEGKNQKWDIKMQIDAVLGSKNVQLRDTEAEATAHEQDMAFGSVIMEAMGWVAIFMAVLSLTTSASSTYVERTRETAILRVLGLHDKEVNRLFYMESLILLFASGISGSISGFVIGWLMYSQINLFLQIPGTIAVPWGTLARTFGISMFMLMVGLWGMFKWFHKRPVLVEVLKKE